MSVPPPASPVAPQHAYFVGDTGARRWAPLLPRRLLTSSPAAETFFEPHAQLRLPRASHAADRKARARAAQARGEPR